MRQGEKTMETNNYIKPKKKSLNEYMETQTFKDKVNQILEFSKHRRENLKLPKGARFKRDAWDMAEEADIVSFGAIMKEFALIMDKRSTLPTSLRQLVYLVVQQGFMACYQEELKEEQEKECNKENEEDADQK